MHIIDRFSEHLKNTLTQAMILATEMQHKNVEPIHLWFALQNTKGSLAYDIIYRQKIDPKIIEQILLNLPTIKTNTKTTTKLPSQELELTPYSESAKAIIEKAIFIAHKYHHNYVGSEHLLMSLLEINNNLIRELFKLNKLNLSEIKEQTAIVLENSTNFPMVSEVNKTINKMQQNLPENLINNLMSGQQPITNQSMNNKTQSALEFFATNLTSEQAQNNLDPVIGRELEIERLIQILARRTKNNPVLLGDPGVGKTAIVEGLAKKIFEESVPEILLNKKIYALDMGVLIAGTSFRGEFEGRLQQVIEEVSNDPNIILFIDEIHNIVGAGSNQGTMDAANLLKPALSRGEIHCIGATTPLEFKKYIESDPALERRLQPIIVKQSSVDETIQIIKGLRKNYETYHNIAITDEAIESATKLSDRYITGKLLPDKAIDLIDETSASKKLLSKISNEHKQLFSLQKNLEKVILNKEKSALNDDFKSAVGYKQEEKKLKLKITKIKKALEKNDTKPTGKITKKDVLTQLAKIIGTPVDDLLLEGKEKFKKLKTKLKGSIIGQDKTIEAIIDIIQQAQLRLSNPNRPLASFLFVGESGVGKTQTALNLAKLLYSNEEALIKLDMSEFNESFGVSKLLGSPAGYVGYKEQNRFTDKLKLHPYCVLLLDEIDKAHQDVTKLLLQMLENGEITDSQNRKISLKHAIIIMTTTVGSEMLHKQEIGFDKIKVDSRKTANLIQEKLKEYFSPEIINRLDKICIFNNLTINDLAQIAKLEVAELNQQLKKYHTKIESDKTIMQKLMKSISNNNLNARYIRNTIRKDLEKLISEKIITNKLKNSFKIGMVKNEIIIK